MNCPKCGKYLTPEIPTGIHIKAFQEFNDVNFNCENGHAFFTRIHLDDLIATQVVIVHCKPHVIKSHHN
jgi:hypothetical protein